MSRKLCADTTTFPVTQTIVVQNPEKTELVLKRWQGSRFRLLHGSREVCCTKKDLEASLQHLKRQVTPVPTLVPAQSVRVRDGHDQWVMRKVQKVNSKSFRVEGVPELVPFDSYRRDWEEVTTNDEVRPALASPALASPALASPALASPALASPTWVDRLDDLLMALPDRKHVVHRRVNELFRLRYDPTTTADVEGLMRQIQAEAEREADQERQGLQDVKDRLDALEREFLDLERRRRTNRPPAAT